MLADNVVSMNVNYSKTHTYFMYVPTCTTDFYVFVLFFFFAKSSWDKPKLFKSTVN